MIKGGYFIVAPLYYTYLDAPGSSNTKVELRLAWSYANIRTFLIYNIDERGGTEA